MKVRNKKNLKEYVNRWKETGKFLEKLRREEICNSNLEQSIIAFQGVFESALFLQPNKKTSGLVEFHKVLAKSK
jgi:hypothetical protein